MDNENKSAELEQMTRQMAELKDLLRNQQIVNTRLMRRAIKADVIRMRRNTLRVSIAATLCMPLNILMLRRYDFPLWFGVFTMLFFIVAVGANYYTIHHYMSPGLITCNLSKAVRSMASYKRFYYRWLIFAIPVAVTWVASFAYYCSRQENSAMLEGVVVGAVVGGLIGLRVYYRQMARVDSIICQIEEIKASGAPEGE